MPFVEKKFRIKAEKRYRAVSGLSMGGTEVLFMHCIARTCFLPPVHLAHGADRLLWRRQKII